MTDRRVTNRQAARPNVELGDGLAGGATDQEICEYVAHAYSPVFARHVRLRLRIDSSVSRSLRRSFQREIAERLAARQH